MERKSIGALVVALAIGAAGCGSSEKPLTRAEFTAKATAICKQHRAHAEAVERTQRSFKAALAKAYPILQERHAALQALKPPAALEQSWKRYLAVEAAELQLIEKGLRGHPDPHPEQAVPIHAQLNARTAAGVPLCI